ncbi:hypothetical protein ABZ663_03960, partial [Streptomyces albidoflavus]
RVELFTTLNEPWCSAFLGYARPALEATASAQVEARGQHTPDCQVALTMLAAGRSARHRQNGAPSAPRTWPGPVPGRALAALGRGGSPV